MRGTAADAAAVAATLELYDVDPLGLDRLDRAVMRIVLERFDGGPVGLSTLSVSVGEEAETIESVVEPFLVRIGLLARTPRGRVATPAAFEHFGIRLGYDPSSRGRRTVGSTDLDARLDIDLPEGSA